jgi:glycosyltransferase involved in cell wall biosynthesis
MMVLYVGRLAKQKCVDVLLKSAQLVLAKEPKILFVIAGNGPERKYLESLKSELHLDNNVVFTGAIPFDEIPLYFHSCDLFAITSHHEGTCMVLLEAALADKAIVSTRFAGSIDLLDEFQNTALCDIGNYKQIADKILLCT